MSSLSQLEGQDRAEGALVLSGFSPIAENSLSHPTPSLPCRGPGPTDPSLGLTPWLHPSVTPPHRPLPVLCPSLPPHDILLGHRPQGLLSPCALTVSPPTLCLPHLILGTPALSRAPPTFRPSHSCSPCAFFMCPTLCVLPPTPCPPPPAQGAPHPQANSSDSRVPETNCCNCIY